MGYGGREGQSSGLAPQGAPPYRLGPALTAPAGLRPVSGEAPSGGRMPVRVRARDLVVLPWGWAGPSEERDEHGNTWWELRIRELPDFLVAAESRDQVV